MQITINNCCMFEVFRLDLYHETKNGTKIYNLTKALIA
jgi:hypothetical protein